MAKILKKTILSVLSAIKNLELNDKSNVRNIIDYLKIHNQSLIDRLRDPKQSVGDCLKCASLCGAIIKKPGGIYKFNTELHNNELKIGNKRRRRSRGGRLRHRRKKSRTGECPCSEQKRNRIRKEVKKQMDYK